VNSAVMEGGEVAWIITNNGKSRNQEIPTIHTTSNPENLVIITYWLCYLSVNSESDTFPVEERNPCSVVNLLEKQ
jgi:hypothetical protein